MDAVPHPIKTAAGQAELSTRALRLSQRHRTVLFLVDGRRSESEVRTMATQAGVPDTCFDELVVLGLIGPLGPFGPLGASGVAGAGAGVWPQPLLEVDLPLPDAAPAELDSMLPASRTLSPESMAADSRFEDRALESAWGEAPGAAALTADAAADPVFLEAREILVRAVRSVAPVAGSITLMRLRRARTRAELASLLDEVEQRIAKPPRPLAAAQTLRRVRELLDERATAPLTP